MFLLCMSMLDQGEASALANRSHTRSNCTAFILDKRSLIAPPALSLYFYLGLAG